MNVALDSRVEVRHFSIQKREHRKILMWFEYLLDFDISILGKRHDPSYRHLHVHILWASPFPKKIVVRTATEATQ